MSRVDYFVFEHSGLDMPNDSRYDSICSRKGVVAQGADSDRSLGSPSTELEN